MEVVVSGSTGFIGSEITRYLLPRSDVTKIYLIIRPQLSQSPEQRFGSVISYWKKFFRFDDVVFKKIKIINYNLENLSEPFPEISSCDFFFNCAASTALNPSMAQSRKSNVVTTLTALEIARRVAGLRRFVHFSTAYVSGNKTGLIKETDSHFVFNNSYERTKWESEDAVKSSGLPFTILRPSMVIGDSQTGYIKGFKVIYAVFRMWLTDLIPRAPLDKKAKVDVVPVDYLVKAALKLAELDTAVGNIYHVCAGQNIVSPTEIFDCALKVFEMKNAPMAPQWMAKFLDLPFVRPFLSHGLKQIFEVMRWHLSYLGSRNRIFDMTKTDQVLRSEGIICPSFSEYGENIFKFCKETKWGKKSLVQ